MQPSMAAREAASCEARLRLKGFALRRLGGFLSPIPYVLWPRVRGEGGEGVDRCRRRQDRVHRTGKADAERLCGEFQRQDAG